MVDMSLYAVTPARRVRQLGADLLVLAWVVLWCLLGWWVHAAVVTLRGPADQLLHAGTEFHDGMSRTGHALGRLPVVGDQLGPALDKAAASGGSLAQAGHGLSDGVGRLALVLALLTAVVPILLVLLPWLSLRLRFALRSRTAQRELAAGAGPELFALRALARQPVDRLRAVSADPAGDWRRGEPGVVRALADLELADLGVLRTGRRPG